MLNMIPISCGRLLKGDGSARSRHEDFLTSQQQVLSTLWYDFALLSREQILTLSCYRPLCLLRRATMSLDWMESRRMSRNAVRVIGGKQGGNGRH